MSMLTPQASRAIQNPNYMRQAAPQQQAPSPGLQTGAPTQGQQPAAPGGSLSNILAGLGISNVSPLQPLYAPNPPMIAPAQMTAASAGVPQQGTSAGDLWNALGPQQSIGQILNYAQPLFQRAQSSLNDQLAAAGMFGGPALNATSALNSNLMSSIGPMLAQAVQGSQSNQLQQALANAGFQQQAGGENLNALNAGNAMNVQNLINQNMYNTQAANAGQNNLFNALFQNWQIPFNAYSNINQAGLSGAQSLAGIGAGNAGNLSSIMAQTFPVQQPPDFSSLGGALGSLFAPQQQAPQPTPPFDYTGFV